MKDLQWEQWLGSRRATQEDWKGRSYLRLATDIGPFPKGTVRLGERTVYGYPKIPRIEALRNGLRSHFRGPFWAEEKLDGYNARVLLWEGELVAFTRGGFLCPFTTDRVVEWVDPRIFEKHPRLVLCGEVVGPGNPYVSDSNLAVPGDVGFFLFDLMETDSPGFLSHGHKVELAERFRIPLAPVLGRFTVEDIEGIADLVRKLDEEGREGIVFKAEEPDGLRLKYVTAASAVADIAAMGTRFYDVHPTYFTSRVLRLALFLAELGARPSFQPEVELGRALLQSHLRAIEQFCEEGRSSGVFFCRFRKRENAEALLEHLHKLEGEHARTVVQGLDREGNYWVLRFRKIYSATTDLLRNVWGGAMRFD